ncbi:SDR family oxidoreductase [Blastopirellula sp. JC732]|uniref:Enoyl-[acyl-carrier-protein] reductase [NADH] n=1 Tax=Blastopirellula sediminis TaxID=2894196 RepID=A0A9X1SFK2_9BACT|nr:SDR family oxidoreductase [Blastopirellula sediminis]MCC9608815.1 SDR family oxidoreductase [Blastopirellula sediminis]MCC9628408.1 SDR family oxidoreductase [Blastopirellula sediminis]
MSDFLQLAGKTFVVTGVANRKSIAWKIAEMLEGEGAKVVYVVRSEARKESLAKLLADREVHVCDVEREEEIAALTDKIAANHQVINGLVHSIAFADYSEGMRPFHETTKKQFLQAVDISCFSLVALSNALKDLFAHDASVVTISISTTRMASENYGFMAPIKAALDSSLAFLAKSFSQFSHVRFNAVGPSLLKTSASAGIPGYVDAYLFAEQAIPRKKALQTDEAASVAIFLLSPRSSGIQAQNLVVDAGMSINYFDRDIIERTMNK